MVYYARTTWNLCPYFNDKRSTVEAVVTPVPPAQISYAQERELRLAKFRMMEQGLIGDTFSAIALSCLDCQACIPLRINLNKFTLNHGLQQVKKSGLIFDHSLDFPDPVVHSGEKSAEYFDLFSRYVKVRHPKSKFATYDQDGFRSYIFAQNRLLSLRDPAGKLVAAATVDVQYDPSLHKSMHFHYAFYDTDKAYKNKSLGTLLWILGVEHALRQGLEHIYVGAGAEGSPKLAYKFAYPGLEAFVEGKWVDYDPALHKTKPDYSQWLAANTMDITFTPIEGKV